MQEEQTVSFEPMYVDGPMPWHQRLFVWYVWLVAVLIVFRLVKFGIRLHRLKKLSKADGKDCIGFSVLWADSYEMAGSMKNFAVLTFLLSILEFSWSAIDNFSSLQMQKTSHWQPIVMRLTDALGAFMAGLIICIALFASSMLMQYLLKRRKPESATTASVPSP